MSLPLNDSVASYVVGDRRYPMVTRQACLTCRHPDRRKVEEQALDGVPWATIVASLPHEHSLSERNIREHMRNHVPVEDVAVQQWLEKQGLERGVALGRGAEQVVEVADFCRAIVGRTAERLARGEAQPSVRDALAASEMLARFEREDDDTDVDFVAALIRLYEIAEQSLAPHVYAAFLEDARADPVLRMIEERRSRQRRL